jgi:hypothetical protein
MTHLQSTGNVWIFQANPKKYDIMAMLGDRDVVDEFHWKVSRYRGDILPGDNGLIWLSGDRAGIYAVTQILSTPGYQPETEAERKYWLRDAEDRTELRVKMKMVTDLLAKPITRDEIKLIGGLQDLSILKNPRGTNFMVSAREWLLISELGVRHKV